MKKLIFLFGLMLLTSLSISAKPVDELKAKKAAYNFLVSQSKLSSVDLQDEFEHVYTAKSKAAPNLFTNQETKYFYVFNFSKNGFVIVSADDNVYPILGYSIESSFMPDVIPLNIQKWLEGYLNQIRYIIDNNITASQDIQLLWENYSNSANPSLLDLSEFVEPLIETKWSQGEFFNALCPIDDFENEKTVTGCVATAMAQIMKYWNYPEQGMGYHEYTHPKYGMLSASFSSTIYKWDEMPAIVDKANSAVATLMYHCGISVDMYYNTVAAGGSTAKVFSMYNPKRCAETAFKKYFGYSGSLEGVERSNFTESEWITLIKKEIDEKRPFIYTGNNSQLGHAFICDGYDEYYKFHFNWGWGGKFDGYFYVNSLVPDESKPSLSFNLNQMALIGIEPLPSKPSRNIVLADNITLQPDTVHYDEDVIVVNSTIANNGLSDFYGELVVAAYDESMNYVGLVGMTSLVEFEANSKNMRALLVIKYQHLIPGKYYLFIMFRSGGAEWEPVRDFNNFKNLAELVIISPNELELFSDITISPKNMFVQGSSGSVNFNIKNIDKIAYKGEIKVVLKDFKGKVVQQIGSFIEQVGLMPGETYKPPYLTISTDSITAPPGTYLLEINFENKKKQWLNRVGSSYYQNPIKVIVQSPELQPDSYEDNNTVNQAYRLPVMFPESEIKILTMGSNLHVNNDSDFYKVKLNYGFEYSISARLFDVNSEVENNIYTGDAQFTFSKDGTTWSDNYDEFMPGKISLSGEAAAYFQVTPYNPGLTGTYLLEISIQRSPSSDIRDISKDKNPIIYPNPASDFIEINLDNEASLTALNKFQIFDMLGIEVMSVGTGLDLSSQRINISHLPAGVYYIKIGDRVERFLKM